MAVGVMPTDAPVDRSSELDREEKKELDRERTTDYDDPFGNEEFAEVKYKTMAWW